jgi:hypothetical protein
MSDKTKALVTSELMTRRAFVGALVTAGAALSVLPGEVFHGTVRPARPVVSFHMDQPYIDHSGTALPYLRPLGARSAEPVAHLSETTFRKQHVYV